MDSFAMKSENSKAQIQCTNDSAMHFYQSQCIHITNLEFIGCGGNQVRHAEEFVVKDTKFEGQENSPTAIELIETTAQIVSSTFVSNRKGLYRECVNFGLVNGCGFTSDGFSGGAIIATNSTVEISQSRFNENGADFGGAIFAEQGSIINMSGNVFVSNDANKWGGALHSSSSNITIEACEFHGNNTSTRYGNGGALSSYNSTITIEANVFASMGWGGVLYSSSSNITIEACKFYDNNAELGGVLYSDYSNAITIKASNFHNNSATIDVGVLYSRSSSITIEATEFLHNNAGSGGVLYSEHSTVTIEATEFLHNSASNEGGVLQSSSSMITLAGSSFTNNVSPIGAIIYANFGSAIQHIHSILLIDNNMADRYAVIYLSDSEFIGNDSGNVTYSNNLGSLMAFSSNITFTGHAIFVNNQPRTVSGDFQQGGAITLLFQSNIFFDGVCNLEHNHAENGGAIHSTESKLYVNGDVAIAHNTATGNGGGVYLSTSELNCQQKSTFILQNNTAEHRGGGSTPRH